MVYLYFLGAIRAACLWKTTRVYAQQFMVNDYALMCYDDNNGDNKRSRRTVAYWESFPRIYTCATHTCKLHATHVYLKTTKIICIRNAHTFRRRQHFIFHESVDAMWQRNENSTRSHENNIHNNKSHILYIYLVVY